MDEFEKFAFLRTMVRAEVAIDPEVAKDPWELADRIMVAWEGPHPLEPIDEDDVMRAMFDLGMANGGMPEQWS